MEVKVDLLIARVERLLDCQRKIQEEIIWIKQKLNEPPPPHLPSSLTRRNSRPQPSLPQLTQSNGEGNAVISTEEDNDITTEAVSYDEISGYISPYIHSFKNLQYQDLIRTRPLSKALDQTLTACILNFFPVKDLLQEFPALTTKQIIESFILQRTKVLNIYMKIFQKIEVTDVDGSDLHSRLREKLRQNIRKTSSVISFLPPFDHPSLLSLLIFLGLQLNLSNPVCGLSSLSVSCLTHIQNPKKRKNQDMEEGEEEEELSGDEQSVKSEELNRKEPKKELKVEIPFCVGSLDRLETP
jgi:hypothetical protein